MTPEMAEASQPVAGQAGNPFRPGVWWRTLRPALSLARQRFGDHNDDLSAGWSSPAVGVIGSTVHAEPLVVCGDGSQRQKISPPTPVAQLRWEARFSWPRRGVCPPKAAGYWLYERRRRNS